MTIPSVTCGSDEILSFSAGAQTVSLSASATNSPVSWRWEIIAVPVGSTALSETRLDFINGVSTLQNPQFRTDANIAGTYVIQCVATNADGSSRPFSDREDGQQNVIVLTSLEALYLSGSGQWNWGTYNNLNFTKLEQKIDTLSAGVAATTHGSLLLLSADDHTQYHNDTRGDVRYFPRTEFLASSAGAGDAGKVVKLDGSGLLDSSFIPSITPIVHTLGGASHSADTLANLNAKISDATLIDTTDARLSDDRNDADAIHLSVGSEISGLVEKTIIIGEDYFVIEDSEATNEKKYVIASGLYDYINSLGVTDPDAVHFSVSGEYSLSVPEKGTLDGTEQVLIEDQITGEKSYTVASGMMNLFKINELTIKEDAADSDLIFIEDSEDNNNRKAMTVSGLVSHWWKTDTFPFAYWTDLTFPAQAINPPGAASDPLRSSTTGLLEFSASVQNVITGVAQLPHGWKAGSGIRPHIHHRAAPGTDPAGGNPDVVWQLEYKWYNNNDPVPATYSSDPKTFTLSNFSGGLQIADIDSFSEIDGTGMRDSSILEWRLSRMGTDGSDTYADVDVLLEFDIRVLMNGFGSFEEYPGA